MILLNKLISPPSLLGRQFTFVIILQQLRLCINLFICSDMVVTIVPKYAFYAF